MEVIIQDNDKKYFDAQIIYRNVHRLNDPGKEDEALELINELNGMRTGYYSLFLAGDGEIYLRSLMRTGQDPYPLYETLVVGSGISRTLQPLMQEKLGESAKDK